MYLIELYANLIIILVLVIFSFLVMFKRSREKEPSSGDNKSTQDIVENRFGNYCDDCGATIDDKHKFCTNCGKSVR